MVAPNYNVEAGRQQWADLVEKLRSLRLGNATVEDVDWALSQCADWAADYPWLHEVEEAASLLLYPGVAMTQVYETWRDLGLPWEKALYEVQKPIRGARMLEWHAVFPDCLLPPMRGALITTYNLHLSSRIEALLELGVSKDGALAAYNEWQDVLGGPDHYGYLVPYSPYIVQLLS
jgi:hypothetical protein